MINGRYIVSLGAILAGTAVAAGAFGAHMLKPQLSEHMLVVFETSVRYHMFHALALIFSGWVFIQWKVKIFQIAALAFVAGILFFSGSLYLLVLSGTRWLGAVTPLGGLCFIVGWVCLALGFLRRP